MVVSHAPKLDSLLETNRQHRWIAIPHDLQNLLIQKLISRNPESELTMPEAISLEKDKEAKAIMEKAQEEEFIHFAMDLEFLLRKKDKWKTVMQKVLFKAGDITENAEKAEDAIEE